MNNNSICNLCGAKELYILHNGHLKCSSCKKKFSPKKLQFDLSVIEAFCSHKNANEIAKELNCSYINILKRYDAYRIALVDFLEKNYQDNINQFRFYEEYIYRFNRKKSIFDSVNIMVFSDGKAIFCTLLPSFKKFSFISETQLKDFIKWHKIKDKDGHNQKINEFCTFLEEKLKIYNGMSQDKFYLYLKEMEFKFSYNQELQKGILKIQLLGDPSRI